MENGSADYQTKDIICSTLESTDCKTFSRILTMFLKGEKQILNSSADYQTKKIICPTDYKTFSTNFHCCF